MEMGPSKLRVGLQNMVTRDLIIRRQCTPIHCLCDAHLGIPYIPATRWGPKLI